MQTVVRDVRDLDPFDRSALERVVGHRLAESQRVVIQVVDIAAEEPVTRVARDELPEWCDVYEGLSDAEIDALDASIV